MEGIALVAVLCVASAAAATAAVSGALPFCVIEEYQWLGAPVPNCSGTPNAFFAYTTASCDQYFVGTPQQATYIRTYDPAWSTTSYNLTQYAGVTDTCGGAALSVQTLNIFECYSAPGFGAWTYNVTCFATPPDAARNALVRDAQYGRASQCAGANLTGVVNDLVTGFCYRDRTRARNFVLTPAPDGTAITQSVFDAADTQCAGAPVSSAVWAPVGVCTTAGMADGSEHVYTLPGLPPAPPPRTGSDDAKAWAVIGPALAVMALVGVVWVWHRRQRSDEALLRA